MIQNKKRMVKLFLLILILSISFNYVYAQSERNLQARGEELRTSTEDSVANSLGGSLGGTACIATDPIEQYSGRVAYEITTDEPTICRYSFERKNMFGRGDALEGVFPFGYKPNTPSEKHYFVTGFGSVDEGIVDLDLLREECNNQEDIDGDGVVPCRIYVQCQDLNGNVMNQLFGIGFGINLAPDEDGPRINLADNLATATLRQDQSNVPVVDVIVDDISGVQGCKVFDSPPESFTSQGGINLERQLLEDEITGEEYESSLFSLPEGQSINVGNTGDATLYIVCRDDARTPNDAQRDWIIPRSPPLQSTLSDPDGSNIDVTDEGRDITSSCTNECICRYKYRQEGNEEWDVSFTRFDPADVTNNREHNLRIGEILPDGNNYEVNLVCVDDVTGAREDTTWTVNMNVHPVVINTFNAETSGDGRTVTARATATGGNPDSEIECKALSSETRDVLEVIGFDASIESVKSGVMTKNGDNFEYTFPNLFNNGQHYFAVICRDSSSTNNDERELLSRTINTPDIDISFVPPRDTTINEDNLNLIIETRGGINNGEVSCKYLGGNVRDLERSTEAYDDVSTDNLIRLVNRDFSDHLKHNLRLPATGSLSAGTHSYKIICKEETGKEGSEIATYTVQYNGLGITNFVQSETSTLRPVLSFETQGGRNNDGTVTSCSLNCNDIDQGAINLVTAENKHTVTFNRDISNGVYGCNIICNDGSEDTTKQVSFTISTPAITIETATLSPLPDENGNVEHSRPALIVETKGGMGNGFGDSTCYYLTQANLGNTILNSDFSDNPNKVLLDNIGVRFTTGQGVTKHRKILPTLAQGSQNTYFIQCKNFDDGKLANKNGNTDTYYETVSFKVDVPELYLQAYDIVGPIAPSYSWHFMSKGGANNGDVSCSYSGSANGALTKTLVTNAEGVAEGYRHSTTLRLSEGVHTIDLTCGSIARTLNFNVVVDGNQGTTPPPDNPPITSFDIIKTSPSESVDASEPFNIIIEETSENGAECRYVNNVWNENEVRYDDEFFTLPTFNRMNGIFETSRDNVNRHRTIIDKDDLLSGPHKLYVACRDRVDNTIKAGRLISFDISGSVGDRTGGGTGPSTPGDVNTCRVNNAYWANLNGNEIVNAFSQDNVQIVLETQECNGLNLVSDIYEWDFFRNDNVVPDPEGIVTDPEGIVTDERLVLPWTTPVYQSETPFVGDTDSNPEYGFKIKIKSNNREIFNDNTKLLDLLEKKIEFLSPNDETIDRSPEIRVRSLKNRERAILVVIDTPALAGLRQDYTMVRSGSGNEFVLTLGGADAQLPLGEYTVQVYSYDDNPQENDPSEIKTFRIVETISECVENWQCIGFTPTICPTNGQRTQTCTDSNNCGTTINKPLELESCTPGEVVSTCSDLTTQGQDTCITSDLNCKWYRTQCVNSCPAETVDNNGICEATTVEVCNNNAACETGETNSNCPNDCPADTGVCNYDSKNECTSNNCKWSINTCNSNCVGNLKDSNNDNECVDETPLVRFTPSATSVTINQGEIYEFSVSTNSPIGAGFPNALEPSNDRFYRSTSRSGGNTNFLTDDLLAPGDYTLGFCIEDQYYNRGCNELRLLVIGDTTNNNPAMNNIFINGISGGSGEFEIGEIVDVRIEATDSDGDNLVYNIVNENGDVALMFEKVEGTINRFRWRISAGTSLDSYIFSAKVEDGRGGVTTRPIYITVNSIGSGNAAPIANAGPDQIITLNQAGVVTVQLDGSRSSDPDGDSLTYRWSNGLNGVNPSITYSNNGVYDVILTVDDGRSTDTDIVRIQVNAFNNPPPTNDPPTANAGDDKERTLGLNGRVTVQFDGSSSNDPESQPLIYEWNFGDGSSIGQGSVISHDYTSAGLYTVNLRVTDSGGLVDEDETRVTINELETCTEGNTRQGSCQSIESCSTHETCVNSVWDGICVKDDLSCGSVNNNPVADAGNDMVVTLDSNGRVEVEFDGSGSSDPDGDSLNYRWSNNLRDVNPRFIYTSTGTYDVVLTVNDGRGGIATDTVRVTVNPYAGVCTLSNVRWLDSGSNIVSTADGGDDVILTTGGGPLCEGRTVNFEIYKDIRFGADVLVDDKIATVAEREAGAFWKTVYEDNSRLRGYYFKALVDGQELKSSTLRVNEPVPGPSCGNGVVDSGEECDGNSGSCTDIGNYGGGSWNCNSDCTINTDTCTPDLPVGTCGNGVINNGETCDSSNWGAISGCSDLDGFISGTLRCNSAGTTNECHFNTNNCVPESGTQCPTVYEPVCGDDGNTYGNSCLASRAGVDIAHEGECGEDEVSCSVSSIVWKNNNGGNINNIEEGNVAYALVTGRECIAGTSVSYQIFEKEARLGIDSLRDDELILSSSFILDTDNNGIIEWVTEKQSDQYNPDNRYYIKINNVNSNNLDVVEGTTSNEICTDNIDNDGDGHIDCNDLDCSANAACSGTGTLLTIVDRGPASSTNFNFELFITLRDGNDGTGAAICYWDDTFNSQMNQNTLLPSAFAHQFTTNQEEFRGGNTATRYYEEIIKPNGEHKFYVRCVDSAGTTISLQETSVRVNVPDSNRLRILTAVPNGGTYGVTSVDIGVNTAGGRNNGASASCSYAGSGLNGNLNSVLVSGNLYAHTATVNNVPIGTNTFTITCNDGAETVTQSINFNVEVDTTAPEIVQIVTTGGTKHIRTNEPAFCKLSTSSNVDAGGDLSRAENGRKHLVVTSSSYYAQCRDEWGNLGNVVRVNV